jgi:NAD(P)-dependent dehydrogenase (short-subunit alcohol dehydrogenase family)
MTSTAETGLGSRTLDGKTMIVAGVGPGLGREIALAARREGATLVLAARTEATLRSLTDELDPTGADVAYQVTDVADPEHCDLLVDAALDRYGRLDTLVLVAALDTVFGGVMDTSDEDWRRTFEVNLFGAMALTRAAVPALEPQGGGVVFVGSQAMYSCQVPQVAYAASKAALTGAVTHLTTELGRRGIRVNTVVPSWMWGPAVETYLASTADAQGVPVEKLVSGIAANIPLGEIVPDADVAEAVVFLSSDRARSITGQSLLVNGGEYIR